MSYIVNIFLISFLNIQHNSYSSFSLLRITDTHVNNYNVKPYL